MRTVRFGFESMGTLWEITLWDEPNVQNVARLKSTVLDYCQRFDHTYSRFIKKSLIFALGDCSGLQKVPEDLVTMLRLYKKLYDISCGKFTPLVADTLSDLGYDMDYSLNPKPIIRNVPLLNKAVKIIDATHIKFNQKVTIDVGALGKGFAVDGIASILEGEGNTHYLINGSGDIRYKGKESIQVGLEHPLKMGQVIGKVDFLSGAMCSSAGNRRAWGGFHHIIDPDTRQSPTEIIASWVIAPEAMIADALATALFLSPPEYFQQHFEFEYLLLNKHLRVKRSKGFAAELF